MLTLIFPLYCLRSERIDLLVSKEEYHLEV